MVKVRKSFQTSLSKITDPAILQALKTRDKQKNAAERRRSFDEQRRMSWGSINQAKFQRTSEHYCREANELRNQEIRVAPIQLWCKYLALLPRFQTMKVRFEKYRAEKRFSEAALTIQKGWKDSGGMIRYHKLISVIDKHRGNSLMRLFARRRKNAAVLVQRYLTHSYRHRRFVNWGKLIVLRTIQLQRAVRNFLACNRARVLLLGRVWTRLIQDPEGETR